MNPASSQESLTIHVEHKPHCVLFLEVEVPAALVEAEFEKAIKALNKEISLPGYRKGKAPRDYMLRHYRSSIERRWQDELAEVTFQQALRQTSLYPMDGGRRVQCHWQKCQLGEAAKCTFEYETLPQVPQIDLGQLSIEMPSKPCVCDHEIDAKLQELAKRYAVWEDADHDQPHEGDWLEVEALDSANESIYMSKRFEFTSVTMPHELYQATETLKVGQSCQAKLKRPSSGELIEATVTLHKILKRQVAAIDDQLAVQLGLKDLEALKEHIAKNLSEAAKGDFRQSCFEAIQKALSQHYQFDIPQSTLLHETRMQENSLLSEMEKSEEEMSESEKEEWRAKAKERAEAAIRQTFLLHKIAAQEQIKIADSEVHELMRPFLYELEKEHDQQRLRQRFQNLYHRCRMHLTAEKTLEQIAHSRGWL